MLTGIAGAAIYCKRRRLKFRRAQSQAPANKSLENGDAVLLPVCQLTDPHEREVGLSGLLPRIPETKLNTIQRVRTPIIAAIHGSALAGGTGLVANAHIVIAKPDTVLGLTEIRIGLWPVLIFRSVVQAMGERRTMELALTGREFSAAEARDYGLVTDVAEDPLQRATELAGILAGFSRSRSKPDWTMSTRFAGFP
jgi:hypothetical protein